MSDYYYPKAHYEDDGIIGINIVRVPRWKESELSGDEWRFTLAGAINYKDWKGGGMAQALISGGDMPEIALRVAAWCSENKRLLSPPYTVDDLAKLVVCFQPGCIYPPENVYQIKQEWTWFPYQGYQMDRRNKHPVVRAFCARHSHRGDCDLEDQDDNYELLAYFPQAMESSDDR